MGRKWGFDGWWGGCEGVPGWMGFSVGLFVSDGTLRHGNSVQHTCYHTCLV